MESGVARTEIKDWDAYCVHLRELMGYESKLTRQLYDTARRSPQRVVFAEGIHPNMLKAAVEAKAEGICHPILLGNDEAIGKLAEEMELSLEGIEIVNLRHPDESERPRALLPHPCRKTCTRRIYLRRSQRQDVRTQLLRYDDGGNRRCRRIHHRTLYKI